MQSTANRPRSVSISGGAWSEVTPGERFNIRTSATETEGIYTILEVIADPRNGVPLHVHSNEEEHFVVLEGSVHLRNGDQNLELSAGQAATVKRGTPHAWANLSGDIVRMLIIFSPGHIEKTFRLIASLEGGDLDAILESNESDGAMIVGPPPFDGVYTVLAPRPLP
jgi:mannose-6-phosphate isomerase-like protein (cupin superfamily)